MSTSLLFTIIILLLIITVLILSRINSSKRLYKRKDRLLTTLEKLEEHIESENEFERRDGIIRLDNLLAKAFNYRYGNDKKCGDNLKKSKKLFRRDTYQNLWSVHKLRNDIVHNNRSVSIEESKNAYHIYKLCIRKILK